MLSDLPVLQVYPLKACFGRPLRKQRDDHVKQQRDQQNCPLQAHTLPRGRVQEAQRGKVVQAFCDTDQHKGSNAEREKGPSDAIGGPEEAPQKKQIERSENQEGKGQKNRVRIHHGIAGINGAAGEDRHAQSRQQRHHQESQALEKADCKVLRGHRVPFAHRQKRGIERVIGFAGALKGLKLPQANEKAAHQNGIAGQQRHQGKQQEEPGQRRSGQPQLLFKQVSHGNPPSHSGA